MCARRAGFLIQLLFRERKDCRKKEAFLIRNASFSLAGEEGFEPSTKVLETHVLPLHHSPVQRVYYTAGAENCQPHFSGKRFAPAGCRREGFSCGFQAGFCHCFRIVFCADGLLTGVFSGAIMQPFKGHSRKTCCDGTPCREPLTLETGQAMRRNSFREPQPEGRTAW